MTDRDNRRSPVEPDDDHLSMIRRTVKKGDHWIEFLLHVISKLEAERDALRAAVVMILTEYEHGHNRIDEAKADRLAALLEKTDCPVEGSLE